MGKLTATAVQPAYYGELVWIFTVFELWLDGHSDRHVHPLPRW